MPLKAVLDTLDDLKEDQRGLYVENEGKFYLDLDADSVKDHPATKPLKVAFDRLKGETAETKSKLTEALAKLEVKPNPTKADEAEMIRLRETLEGERDRAFAERDELKSTVYRLTVESQLEAELRNAGIVEPAFLRAAKRDLADLVKVVDGRAVVQTADVGDFSLPDYIKRYVTRDGAAFVSPPKGGGAGGGKSSGGFGQKKPEELSLTERASLLKDDPEAFYRAFPKAKLR